MTVGLSEVRDLGLIPALEPPHLRALSAALEATLSLVVVSPEPHLRALSVSGPLFSAVLSAAVVAEAPSSNQAAKRA
jgi:hypothetical protein